MQNKITKIPNFATPMQLGGDFSAKVTGRKIIQDASKEIPFYPDPVFRLPPKPIKIPVPKIPGSLSDIDLELKTDSEDNSPYQEGVI